MEHGPDSKPRNKSNTTSGFKKTLSMAVAGIMGFLSPDGVAQQSSDKSAPGATGIGGERTEHYLMPPIDSSRVGKKITIEFDNPISHSFGPSTAEIESQEREIKAWNEKFKDWKTLEENMREEYFIGFIQRSLNITEGEWHSYDGLKQERLKSEYGYEFRLIISRTAHELHIDEPETREPRPLTHNFFNNPFPPSVPSFQIFGNTELVKQYENYYNELSYEERTKVHGFAIRLHNQLEEQGELLSKKIPTHHAGMGFCIIITLIIGGLGIGGLIKKLKGAEANSILCGVVLIISGITLVGFFEERGDLTETQSRILKNEGQISALKDSRYALTKEEFLELPDEIKDELLSMLKESL